MTTVSDGDTPTHLGPEPEPGSGLDDTRPLFTPGDLDEYAAAPTGAPLDYPPPPPPVMSTPDPAPDPGAVPPDAPVVATPVAPEYEELVEASGLGAAELGAAELGLAGLGLVGPDVAAPDAAALGSAAGPPPEATAYGDLPGRPVEHAVPAPTAPGPPRRSTPSGAGRIVLPIALGLVSIVALVAGWQHLQSDRAAATSPTGLTSSAAKPPVPTLGGTPTTSPTPAASTSPTPAATTSPTSKPTTSATSKPTSSASAPAAGSVDRSVPVVVLNATSRTGLAASVASTLRAEGWKVVSVGNWRKGGVPATAVFVKGEADAAATLRKDLPAVGVVRAPLAGMPAGRLVVVIGADYPR